MKEKNLRSVILCVFLTHATWGFAIRSSSDQDTGLSVEVTGTREAVIDSQVHFTAELMNGSVPWLTNSSLRYEWSTDACHGLAPTKEGMCTEVTCGHGSSHLTRLLTRYDVRGKGQYHMFVEVSMVDQGGENQILGIGNQKFKLTDKLNGQMLIEQNTSVTRPPSIFSTQTMFKLLVNLSDVLDNVQELNYTWVLQRHNSTAVSTYRTTVPYREIEVLNKGKYTMSVTLNASMDVTDDKNTTHVIKRDGIFQTKAVFIDPIKYTVFNGSTSYALGSNLSASIQCSGSGPFVLNATVTDPKQSTILVERIDSGGCDFLITIQNLHVEGSYLVVYIISNPVTEIRQNVTLHVHSYSAPVTSDLVQVFAVVVGLLAPFIVIYVYIHERSNKRRIEAADFKFRPLHMEHDTYRTIKTKIRKFFRRKRPGVLSRDVSMQGFGTVQSDEQTETSPASTGTNSSGYGAISTSDRSQPSGHGDRASKVPWLERSSENSGGNKYCSPWLIERPTSPWSSNYTRDSFGMDDSPSVLSSTDGSPAFV